MMITFRLMKLRLLTIAAIAVTQCSIAQDSLMFRKIADEALMHGTCYDNLHVLCKTVGNRISGSPAAAKAVEWGQKYMKATGADSVWLMPADVPYWKRGKESLMIKAGNGQYKKITALSLGNSEGTGGKVLEEPIVMVNDISQFKDLPDEAVKGKIIFFNYRFRQDFVFTFKGYGDAVKYRWFTPSLASARGAAGVIIRSISTGKDDFPHTGSMRYADTVKKIPEMAIGNNSADSLEVWCKHGNVSGKMQSECHMQERYVRSYNVIGEIKGSKYPEKIITVGGHLDSWDVGEGAQDDGAGCVQSMEVLRIYKALGIRPKYTIRAVLFMNEENGIKGGIAYADSAVAKKEQHALVIETDAGGFSPRGIGMEMKEEQKDKIKAFKDLFLPYGVYDFSIEEGGSDISAIQERMHLPAASLIPDSQRYFDLHHTDNDVFENVNHRELKLGAAVLAQLIYLASEHELF